MRSEITLPLDVITEISLKILPKEVPKETIAFYRSNFFAKIAEPVKIKDVSIEEDEDSQEEIQLIDAETLLNLDA